MIIGNDIKSLNELFQCTDDVSGQFCFQMSCFINVDRGIVKDINAIEGQYSVPYRISKDGNEFKCEYLDPPPDPPMDNPEFVVDHAIRGVTTFPGKGVLFLRDKDGNVRIENSRNLLDFTRAEWARIVAEFGAPATAKIEE